MGQYYRGCILDKNYKKDKTNKNPVLVSFTALDFNDGSKLMEHSWVDGQYVKVYEHLLSKNFYGYPLVWCGDYAETKIGNRLIAYYHGKHMCEESSKTYLCDSETEKTWGGYPLKMLKDKYKVPNGYAKYIVNLDKKLYAPIPSDINQIHPLPILTCDGCGKGGGDYDGSNMELVGIWAYDRIGVCEEIPNGFKPLEYKKNENVDEDVIFVEND